MTKKLKTTLLSILSALLLVTALFFVSPATAKAEEDAKEEKGQFYFQYGAEISAYLFERLDENEDASYDIIKEPRKFRMRFTLSPTDGNYDCSELLRFVNSVEGLSIERVKKQTAHQSFKFTLRRRKSGSSDKATAEYVPLHQVVITYYFPDEDSLEVGYFVTTKKLSNCNETIYFPQMTGAFEGAGENYENIKEVLPSGWDGDLSTVKRNVKQGLFDDYGRAYIGLNVDSPYEHYDVLCEYSLHATKKAFLNTKTRRILSKCSSVSRSIQQVLQFMEADEYGDYLGYESEINHFAYSPDAGEVNLWDICKEIVGTEKKRTIKLSYLEEIPNTPFARKKQISVEANTLSSGVTLQDVYAATNDKDFSVFNSNVYNWKTKDAERGLYEAQYLKDTYLKSKTKDNKELKYFFDINTSFEDAFYSYVEKGFLSVEEYEKAYSQIFNKYTSLKTMTPSEVYGRFGLIVSPDTKFTINALLTEIFGADEQTLGVKVLSQGKTSVNMSQYNALLNEYEYGFYDKIFDPFFTILTGEPVEVDYYILYSVADGEIREKSPTEKVKDWIKKAWGTVSNFVGNLLGITENATKSKATVVLIVVCAGVGVGGYFLIKSGALTGLIGKNSKSKSKSRRKK